MGIGNPTDRNACKSNWGKEEITKTTEDMLKPYKAKAFSKEAHPCLKVTSIEKYNEL